MGNQRAGRKTRTTASSSSSGESSISVRNIELIIEHLKVQSCQKQTAKNYLGIWRRFKQFILKLYVRLRAWEDKATLFIGYLIENIMQSSSVKSYLPAIKKTLVDNGYKWNDARVQVATLTRPCRLINDRVMIRFGVHCGLLELILFCKFKANSTNSHI